MRVIVFGASGGTGRLVVELGIRREHEVTAFVRDASKQWFPDGVKVVQGDPHDGKAVEGAIAGNDAVISALGPVAGVTATEISDAIHVIAEAMERLGLGRVIVAANARVFTDEEATGPYANVALEHRRDVAILRASRLDWTVVAAPSLTDDAPTGAYEAAIDAKATGRQITRGDFALVLLDALDHPDWIRHVVGVTNPPD
jgi:putative NADH-flavin reductase